MKKAHSCGGCSTTWNSLRYAHCGKCHITFATVRLFDDHRNQSGPRGNCLEPSSLDMSQRDGIWHGPKMNRETVSKLAPR
jgi:hypothetical protein